MKQYLILSLFVFLYNYSFACDVCGASNSIAGFGSYANGNRTNIGLNYQFKTYHSYHPALFYGPGTNSNELFQRFDLKSQIRLSRRFQLLVDLPLTINRQNEEGSVNVITGLADATIGASYFIINKKDSASNLTFRWNMGAGLKMPTGRYTEHDSSNFMLFGGTGSWDTYFSNLLYLQKNKWVFVSESSFYLRTQNKFGYQAGNTFTTTLLANRNIKSFGIFTGLQYVFVGTAQENRKIIDDSPTTGTIFSNLWGVTWHKKNWMIQGSYHIPLYQSLGNGNTKQKQAFSVSLYYFF